MDDHTFNYTYSAQRQAEVDAIRRKYLPKGEDGMERLRRLDRGATRRGATAAVIVGVAGCLLLGLGMCCTIQWGGVWFVPGVIVGALGIAVMAVAYPLCRRVTAREREWIAPQVLQLADELSESGSDGAGPVSAGDGRA